MMKPRLIVTVTTLVALALCLSAGATELKQKTAAAFNQYAAATQARFANELQPGGAFLYVDGLPAAESAHAYEDLKRGEVLVYKLETRDQGREISVPDGIIHHWVGVSFIPGVNMAQTLAIAQDYDRRAELYKPEVTVSRTLAHNGDDYKIFLRLFQKKFTTIMFNTEYDIHWRKFDATRYTSDSISSRIAEVKDTNNPDGGELPAGQDRGYLWRLNTYWRFQEKDGGVYVQCEVLSLTRDIPTGLGWLLRPLVTSLPKNSLNRVLGRTKELVLQQPKK